MNPFLTPHVTPPDLSVRLKMLGASQISFAFWLLNPRPASERSPGEAPAFLSWHGDTLPSAAETDERAAAFLASELGSIINEIAGAPGIGFPSFNRHTLRWEVDGNVSAISEAEARGLVLEKLLERNAAR